MQNVTLKEDIELLNLLVNSQQQCGNYLYSPGPYWEPKTRAMLRELKKNGLKKFRAYDNPVTTSFSDAQTIDVRLEFSGARFEIVNFFTCLFPANKIFNAQIDNTKSYAERSRKLESIILNKSSVVSHLNKTYIIPEVTDLGGAVRCTDIGGKKISHLYLELLRRLDVMLHDFDISKKRSYFEIGGGFGANLHLLISNFTNLKKFIYLDIAPNLYIGTQYLKAFYGDHVVDCVRSNQNTKLSFTDDNELEILCILPHQIENLNCSVDVFHCANSFIEMPQIVVENYITWIKKLINPEEGVITLNSYENFSIGPTFHPDEIPKMFSMNFKKKINDSLIGISKEYSYFATTKS